MIKIDILSSFIAVFATFFTLLISLYSIGYMKQRSGKPGYYLLLGLTLISSIGAVLANHLILLMVWWGLLGLFLYLLIGYGETERTSATAKKAFIIIGGTDAVMLLGLALIWKLAGTLRMDQIHIPLNSATAITAYLCIAVGALAKAGAMPFHTWVPDMAEDAPIPVTAYLPASMDKLLGIYLLFRLSVDMFVMSPAMNMFLMALGSIGIVAAVMMALIQHDLNRLLGYHAVSQVGYMVLGIGTGNPVGIAGGLFHMLNNTIYKTCLFLSSGSVRKRAGTTDLDRLGGLAKIMPLTFFAFLIASLAISGVPPLNGFASKWMIYQGIISTSRWTGGWWIVWLIAAMFGSALTLASFMKLLNAVFLGQPSQETSKLLKTQGDVGIAMRMPQNILAIFCLIFGIFAYQIPLKQWILPSVGKEMPLSGLWDPSLATLLIILGLTIGLAIYLIGSSSKTREAQPFVGGESLDENPDMRVSGTEFYKTISDIEPLSSIYSLAQRKQFDLYEIGSRITFGINKFLRYLHNGVLPTYLAWCLLGMIVLFFIYFH